jgi:hypothetical protein
MSIGIDSHQSEMIIPIAIRTCEFPGCRAIDIKLTSYLSEIQNINLIIFK